LHYNDGQYRKIIKVADDLCRQHDVVVVCINGDFVTKIVPGPQSSWIVIRKGTDASGSHEDRLGEFQSFCHNLLRVNGKVRIVINLGNHEFMHSKEVAATLGTLIAQKRVHVVSNIDPGNGPFSGLIKPSTVISGITFVGYCTNEIYSHRDCEDAKIRRHFVGDWRSHNRRFKKTIRNVNTPILFLLSHETRNKSGKYVWPMVLKHCPALVKFVAIGHDHGDFRAKTSSRYFGDYRAYSVPNLHNNKYFAGADRIFLVPPYGFGVGILERKKGKYKSETRSLSSRFSGKSFVGNRRFAKSNKLLNPKSMPDLSRVPVPSSVH
jgi:hypothetical protein